MKRKEIIKQSRIWNCRIISGKEMINEEQLFTVFDNIQMRCYQLKLSGGKFHLNCMFFFPLPFNTESISKSRDSTSGFGGF